MAVRAPAVQQRNTQQKQEGNRAGALIPFTRASRRKSQQGETTTVVLQAAAPSQVVIQVPAAGFLRYLEFLFDFNETGNAATVTAPAATTPFPWGLITSVQVTNAAGDSIFVPVDGYLLYLINKYGGNWQPPNCDPYADPAFEAVTTGAGATAGSNQFRLKIPFEQDPRDAFCALPNLAANKAYQVLFQLASVAGWFVGATPPGGTHTLLISYVQHYWSQPQPANGEGFPQEQAPGGVGSVSLYRLQSDTVSGGSRIQTLTNVGNVIRWGVFTLQSSAANNPRTDADWPSIAYLRLNNDQLYYKTAQFWESEMRERYGYGSAAVTKDAAGFLDTGVYVLSDFMSQHEHVTPDGPRDQWLPTLDSTLLQFEAATFGGTAQIFRYLQNEIKPKDAMSLFSLNVV